MRRVVLLVIAALGAAAILTGLAGSARGSQGLNELTWLGTVASVAALIVAIGIYRVQNEHQGAAQSELLDRLDAQDELLADFARVTAPEVPQAEPGEDALTAAQRAAVEKAYGKDAIAAAWKLGAGRGNRPRLVRLTDGRVVSVYSGGRLGGTYVNEVEPQRVDS